MASRPRELNLELIARHEAEHDAGVAFAYARPRHEPLPYRWFLG